MFSEIDIMALFFRTIINIIFLSYIKWECKQSILLAYNVGRLFTLKALAPAWHRRQVQTLRWMFYETAGKVVFHSGAIWLKVRQHMEALFAEVRLKSREFAVG